MSKTKGGEFNPLEAEWAAANPRPNWTPEFWAAARPTHETEEGA